MDSGSSKAFDFASDDILCSYEDYTNQDKSNGTHSDSAIATNSSKEFHKNRMSRPSFPASSYSPPDDSGNQDVIIAAVERSMKKHSENLMRFLEGISSRLSQLELYCYNVDKSVGEMRSDLARDNEEADAKLKFLEKHIQEVHRSVQIIRDKQELADTQKELAKLQLAQKETSAHDSQKSDGTSTPSSDTKRNENTADGHNNQQLALALPHQVAPPPAPQPQMPPQTQPQPQPQPQPMSQSQTYYLSPAQLPNIPGPNQITQNHYLQSDPHYQTPPPPPMSQASQPQMQAQLQPQIQPQPQPQPQPQLHSHPQYQQQWAQQVPQQVQPPQSAVRPSSPQVFPPPYVPNPQVNPPTPETLPNNMPYVYGGPGRTNPQPPPPQHLKPAYGGPPNDGYVSSGPQGNTTYMLYDGEGGSGSGRVQHPSHPSHFPQPVYPPNPQQNSGGNMMARPPPQFMRNHPYNELIDKLGSMGYRGEHVMGVIQRLEETGQTVDFNTVLDRLNAHPSGGASLRGWSG